MTELQQGLWLIGGVLLLALAAHTVWLGRRARRARAQVMPAEPVAPRIEPVAEALAPPVLPDPGRAPPVLDALIDAVAVLVPEGQVSGDAVLAAVAGVRHVGTKPYHVEGQRPGAQAWEPLTPGVRYTRLQAGVQLANRQGALNDIEFSAFVQRVQALADTLNAAVEWPDMRQEVARARELDQFASAHDAQLQLLLRARRAAWSPAFVQQAAHAEGFVVGATAGRMVLPAPDAKPPPWLSLAYDTQAALAEDPALVALREITLGLDAPQIAADAGAYARLCQALHHLAQRLEADVCDDRGVVLGDEALGIIGTELDRLYAALAEHDLAAGSVLARRLFS